LRKRKNQQDDKADREVHESGKYGGNRQDQPREIHLGNDPLVFDHHVGGGDEDGGKVSLGNDGGEAKTE